MNFIALQNSYDDVQIGLFKSDSSAQNQPLLIEQLSIPKINASKLLISSIDQFFISHNLTLADIPFIAVNQGPGPFTTLRVVIATVNGIAFASAIPLIGVDALQAVAQTWQEKSGIIAILFNGFANDTYFLIQENGNTLLRGCKNIDLLLSELKKRNQSITFIGNGATLYKTAILAALQNHAIIPDTYPSYSSIEQIGIAGYETWLKNKNGVQQLLPLYLKNHPAQEKSSTFL